MAQRVERVQRRRVLTSVSRSREPAGRLWAALAAPGIGWLLLCFVAPLYVVLAIVFGQVDPLFRTAVPVWNPLQWNPSQFNYVLSRIVGADGVYGPALLRTVVYILAASTLCLLIAFPVAYYVARLSGRRKGVLLALLIAPFWISYMMRMLAWVNLLQDDGLVNRLLGFGGLFDVRVHWLTGQPVVVILGLAYGYVPYMILPLYAGLDRLSQSMLEASRDLGANRAASFVRVTLPLCRPTILAAVLLTCLPMLGDYFTNDLLSASPKTAMAGNLINDSVQAPGQTGQAGAFVMLVLLVTVLPMLYYVRVTLRGDEVRV
jgi:spermidine/putrescine transport system permease protein